MTLRLPSKRLRPSPTKEQDVAAPVHRAFRRMAILFANLVCGIWLLLLVVGTASEDSRFGVGELAALILLSAPVAYLIPYGLVRLIGVIVAHRRGREA